MAGSARRILIVGAGFSGCVSAAHLLRANVGTALDILLLNRSGPAAGGLAYRTYSPIHVLNVPAGRLGAFADDEGGFLRFVQKAHPETESGDFVPRKWYGDYLEALLSEAKRAAPHDTRLTRLVGEAVSLRHNGLRASVSLRDGRVLEVDRIVLAIGNFSPARQPPSDELINSQYCIRDPWAPGAIQPQLTTVPVLLLGSGLTMADVAVSLDQMGGTKTIYTLSRRGLLPQSHMPQSHVPLDTQLARALLSGPATTRRYVSIVRGHMRVRAQEDRDWREVIDGLRGATPNLWRRLGIGERARFLRHVRPYWDAHRHRLAPLAADVVQRMIACGRLVPLAGRMIRCQLRSGGVATTVGIRGRRCLETLNVGAIINCTGSDCDLRRVDEALIRFLHERGIVRGDPLNLGIDTTEQYEVVQASGDPSSFLFYVGPLLKARYWESTAVPELRHHARGMTLSLLRSLGYSRLDNV